MKRRHLLRGLGFSLAIPFLPSMSKSTAAQEAPAPRFLAFWTPNGQRGSLWHPRPVNPMQVGEHLEYQLADTVDAQGSLSPIFGEGFAPFVSKLSVMRGLDGLSRPNHNPYFALSGAEGIIDGSRTNPTGPTLDWVMANSPDFYGSAPVLDVLRLQPHFSSYFPLTIAAERSADGTFRSLNSQWSSHAVFDSLFAGADQPEPAVDPVERRRFVVDRVYEDFQRVRTSPRLSSDDQLRLDQFAEHMYSLQTRLEGQPILDCAGPALREETETSSTNVYRNHVDLMVAVLACGITRIGTMMMHLGAETGEAGWHGNSHENGEEADARSLRLNQFTSEAFRYLLERMDAVAEPGGGTLLDNSLVYYCNEISSGRGHDHIDMPMLLAGSAGGRLRTGVGFDFRQDPERKWAGGKRLGIPYNWFLHSLMETYGLQDEDWELDGEEGFGQWTQIGHMYSAAGWDRFASRKRERLPGWRV